MTTYDAAFFKSQKYQRACKLMRIPPYANPNYRAELKKAGLWRGKK